MTLFFLAVQPVKAAQTAFSLNLATAPAAPGNGIAAPINPLAALLASLGSRQVGRNRERPKPGAERVGGKLLALLGLFVRCGSGPNTGDVVRRTTPHRKLVLQRDTRQPTSASKKLRGSGGGFWPGACTARRVHCPARGVS